MLKQFKLLMLSLVVCASCSEGPQVIKSRTEMPFADGTLVLTPMASNALRVQFQKEHKYDLPDTWLYPDAQEVPATDIRVTVDKKGEVVRFYDAAGKLLTEVTAHALTPTTVQGEEAYVAGITMATDDDEYLTGLGQFQDGLGNLRGVTRRLTQVNTQISMPVLLSNHGYGLLWNNYGMTDFNPATDSIRMVRQEDLGDAQLVNVTTTEGGAQELRRRNCYVAEIEVEEAGRYCLLLDVGRKMSSRFNLSIDGDSIVDIRNTWLPPTLPMMVDLSAGHHTLMSELTQHDNPIIYYRKVDATTTLSSPVADHVDYTVFAGSADEVIASYRNLTGNSPMMPVWALGYTHCRERYHSSAEILDNARTFREKQLPIDVIVQDWQYWGPHGWNAMQFDEANYPDPSALTAELHDSLHMKLMLSVWSKIDDNSELGKQMKEDGYYIPNTTWIDFFNTEAADAYWKNFSEKLLVHKIDAWWQDATEPENDDLVGRRVDNGRWAGELVRNVYPLLVSQTVYEGLRQDDHERRSLILTRSGFPGIQRYGSMLWSGDVGNDWQTLRYQITGGLGLMAAGHPWWTFDAGGFFRPWGQYTDEAYIERMLRWIQTATFLPAMRVHGYMSETEPWRFGEEAERIVRGQLELRYRLLPYIYSMAWEVSAQGSTLMRPLLFDFAKDAEALTYDTEYMFGHALLVNPVLEPGVVQYDSYLPKHAAGWYDFHTNQYYAGGQTVQTAVTLEQIPVFAKAGSIVPMGPVKQYAQQESDEPWELRIYAGADADYLLYEDEGDNYHCEQGQYAVTRFHWDDKAGKLSAELAEGMPEMARQRSYRLTIVRKEGITTEEVTL